MLEKTEGPITNGQSKDTGNLGFKPFINYKYVVSGDLFVCLLVHFIFPS